MEGVLPQSSWENWRLGILQQSRIPESFLFLSSMIPHHLPLASVKAVEASHKAHTLGHQPTVSVPSHSCLRAAGLSCVLPYVSPSLVPYRLPTMHVPRRSVHVPRVLPGCFWCFYCVLGTCLWPNSHLPLLCCDCRSEVWRFYFQARMLIIHVTLKAA